MYFIDTHTHLYDEAFDPDRAAVLEKAVASGVAKWIFPSIDSTTYEVQNRLALQYPLNAHQAMGLHPTSVAANWREELDFVERHLQGGGYVAVGEIGLDGYWSKEFMKEQMDVFAYQIDMAIQHNLPIIIHERNAMDETFQVLEGRRGKVSGVFHAYSGSIESYRRIKKLGEFKTGIGGVVTFKNAGIAKTVEDIPLEDIVLETDSPWLTPAPYRGKRNESGYIPIIAQKVAEIKGVDIETVARVTTNNAEQLFHI